MKEVIRGGILGYASAIAITTIWNLAALRLFPDTSIKQYIFIILSGGVIGAAISNLFYPPTNRGRGL